MSAIIRLNHIYKFVDLCKRLIRDINGKGDYIALQPARYRLTEEKCHFCHWSNM